MKANEDQHVKKKKEKKSSQNVDNTHRCGSQVKRRNQDLSESQGISC